MTAPANAVEVSRALAQLTNDLAAQNQAYAAAEKDAAEKRHAADMVEARAFLAADGSVEFRKNTAKVAADRQEFEAKVAEALVRVLRQRIRAIETAIDVQRSHGATVRAELKTLGAVEG